ncbi:MAG: DUF2252 family protein [Leptospiraceae bacterium]|nr:DUF2252 family protein [Leptospiraceae bacterium]
MQIDQNSPDVFLALLWEYDKKLQTEYRLEKYEKMSLSPYNFLRGTALHFYDFHRERLLQSEFYSVATETFIQGDLHLSNYGAFLNSAGEIVYDLNDFDEASIQSYLYDVWRLGSCVLIAGRHNFFTEEELSELLEETLESYLDSIENFRKEEAIEFRIQKENADGKLDEFLESVEKKKSRKKMLELWTGISKGEAKFLSESEKPELQSLSSDLLKQIKEAIEVYCCSLEKEPGERKDYFTVLDAAQRLGSGIGSYGTNRYYVLIRGERGGDTCRILDIKEQAFPTIYSFLSRDEQDKFKKMFPIQGKRVIEAEKSILYRADKHLGYIQLNEKSFSVRERSPYKESLEIEKLDTVKKFEKLVKQWTKILAASHVRGSLPIGNRNFHQELTKLIDGNHKEFRAEAGRICKDYAEKLFRDYGFFCDNWKKLLQES